MKDKIKQIVRKKLKAKVLQIKRITEGYSHFMYFVKINKSPSEVIFRFSNNSKKDFNLSKEKYIIEVLRNNKIPAPKILYFSKDCMVLEKINGIRLDTLWDSLSKKEKINITTKMGKMLKDIHKINFNKFGRICEGGEIESDEAFKFRSFSGEIKYDTWRREFYKDSMIDVSRLLSYSGHHNKLAIEYFKHLVINGEEIMSKEKPSLVHGDFMTGHLFVRKINGEYKIVGIIDFEFAHAKDSHFDFIKLHRQGFFNKKYLTKALKEGYGDIDLKRVEFYRLTRDFGFAVALLDSEDTKKSNEVFESIRKKII